MSAARGCGGIGRRARFRSVWGKPRGGSSPLIRIVRSADRLHVDADGGERTRSTPEPRGALVPLGRGQMRHRLPSVTGERGVPAVAAARTPARRLRQCARFSPRLHLPNAERRRRSSGYWGGSRCARGTAGAALGATSRPWTRGRAFPSRATTTGAPCRLTRFMSAVTLWPAALGSAFTVASSGTSCP